MLTSVSVHFCSFLFIALQKRPTSEMFSRGQRETLLAGIPIAFFSGLGVALSVLDDQTSSLVGVAISASLLPPAGKCRFLIKLAWSNVLFRVSSPAVSSSLVNCGMITLMLLVAVVNGEDLDELMNDYGRMGWISLLLTGE